MRRVSKQRSKSLLANYIIYTSSQLKSTSQSMRQSTSQSTCISREEVHPPPDSAISLDLAAARIRARMNGIVLTIQAIKKALAPKTEFDPAVVVPMQYHALMQLPSLSLIRLPVHRWSDHLMDLVPGTTIPCSSRYGMLHSSQFK